MILIQNTFQYSTSIIDQIDTSNEKCIDSASSIMNNKTSTTNYRTPLAIEGHSYIDEALLYQLIDYCKKNNTSAPLIRNLGRYFSSREFLVQSFQKRKPIIRNVKSKTALNSIPKPLNKEEFRALDEDEKDKDESGNFV